MSDSDDTSSTWDNIDDPLDDILFNTKMIQDHSRKHIGYLQYRILIFKIPTIILSGVNAVFSVGLATYVKQETVSTVNCIISLLTAIINGVELFLQSQKQLEQRISTYHMAADLSIKIASVRKIDRAQRKGDGGMFYSEVVSDYKALVDTGLIPKRRLLDDRFSALEKKSPLLQVISPRGEPSDLSHRPQIPR